MQGVIVQVAVSNGGLPKLPVSGGLIASLGVEGDRHNHPEVHGGPRKAVLLVSCEIVDELKARGYPLFYGALGENLTTRGIDFRRLRVGDRLRAGAALLETFIDYKRKNEADAVRLRPHPYEFALYYDI